MARFTYVHPTTTRLPPRRRVFGWALTLVVISAGTFGSDALPRAEAQSRDRVASILRGHGDFRLRVQAALTLGRLQDATALPDLQRALEDSSPAVRAAAASALRRIGSEAALPSLRRARRDSASAVREQVVAAIRAIESRSRARAPASPRRPRPTFHRTAAGVFPSVTVVPREAPVRWSRVRYVVTLGTIDVARRARSPELRSALRERLLEHMRDVRGALVFPSGDALSATALSQIQRRAIPRFQVNGRLKNVRVVRQGNQLSVRCEVAVMLLDDQSSIRGEMQGSATGAGRSSRRRSRAQEQALAEQALDGAVQSALTSARVALARAARR